MKKEVLIESKRSKVILSLFMLFIIIIIISCDSKQQEYSIETLNDLRPTYIITNKTILSELKQIDNNVDFDDSADVLVLYIEKKITIMLLALQKLSFLFLKNISQIIILKHLLVMPIMITEKCYCMAI